MDSGDDQCDFDQLTALVSFNEGEEEDDSDAELDLLASLVEQEYDDRQQQQQQQDSQQQQQHGAQNVAASSGDGASLAVAAAALLPEAADTAEMPASTDAELIAELRRMQERMRMLEAKLSQNATAASQGGVSPNSPALQNSLSTSCPKTSSSASQPLKQSQHKVAPANKANPPVQNISKNTTERSKGQLSTSSSSSGCVSKKSKVAAGSSNAKVRPLEDDIFFGSASSAIGQSVAANGKTRPNESKQGDSDSDWEGLDGERESSLNEYGKEIKEMIRTGPRKRLAHSSNDPTGKSAASTAASTAATTAAAASTRTSAATAAVAANIAAATASSFNARRKSLPEVRSTGLAQNSIAIPSSSYAADRVSNEYLSSLLGVPPSSLSSSSSAAATRVKPSSGGADVRTGNKSKVAESDVLKEPVSGIYIINPLVSSSRLKMLMEGRRFIRQTTLIGRTSGGSTDIDGDWFTMAVLVNKSDPKVSAKGNSYSIWKLSDLSDCDKQPLSFFLFGAVHKEHWKTSPGAVVGILNATFMKNSEKDAKELSMTVDSHNQILHLGVSKDFGICSGTTKNGRKCNNFINTDQGRYCSYHVQAAYKKCSARRAEIQSGFSGVAPRSRLQEKILPKGTTVIYGGQSFSTGTSGGGGGGGGSRGKSKKAITVESLQKHYITQQMEPGAKRSSYNTIALHDLVPENISALATDSSSTEQSSAGKSSVSSQSAGKNRSSAAKEADHEVFHQLLTVPSVGSMNFVKHLKIAEGKEEDTKKVGKKSVPVVTASDLLKECVKKPKEMAQASKSGGSVPSSSRGGSGGAPSLAGGSSGQGGVGSSRLGDVRDDGIPRLGRGVSDDVVDLEFGMTAISSPKPVTMTSSELAKQRAIAKIKSSGGIHKENPNAVKKDSTKVSESGGKSSKKRSIPVAKPSSSGDDGSVNQAEPPRKKSRLIGNLDLNSPEVKKLLEAKSSHANLLTKEEEDRQDAYFDALEQKERMENKLDSVTELNVTAVSCKQCKYTSMKVEQRCIDDSHATYRHPAVKRFYKCKQCKLRCTTFTKYPTTVCSKCGSNDYERTSMLNPRKQPKLASEELNLRGDEIKYLNSFA